MSLNSYSEPTVNYKIRSGKYHTGGHLSALVLNETGFKVQVKYEIQKKGWVPVPKKFLKGETIMEFPEEFRDERGYLELEAKGEMEVPKANLKFLGRVNLPPLENCYALEVIAKNGKSKTKITYHPDLPATGWAKVEVTLISDIGLLNGYKLIAELE